MTAQGADGYRKTIEEALRVSEGNLRLMIESVTDHAIVRMDVGGNVTYWNDGAKRMLGWEEREILGRTAAVIFTPEDREAGTPFDEMRRAEQDGSASDERWHIRKDGRRFWGSGRVTPVRDEGGTLTGFVKVFRNLTEQKLAQEQREQLLDAERAARLEAERVGRMKDEFLATLSHELRTPLNAILGWAQILGRGGAPEEDLKTGAAVIERNARAQAQLVADLLDMSSIVSGKMRLEVQRVDLAGVIQAAMETVRLAAESKGIRLTKVLDTLAGPISGDPHRLQQIVWNLLSNAVKFTPKGGKVEVTLRRVESHLEIGVSDTGQGIKSEFLPYVFERFHQADGSTTRTHGGLGLGLAIVKQLAELHGGSVHVESRGFGQGTTFALHLPLSMLKPPEDPSDERTFLKTQVPGESACPKIHLSGLRVLVVDDEADTRHLFRRVLVDCHAEVSLAGSAEEALALFDRVRPHVLVSDIGMPGMDGYEFIRRVRALGAERGGLVPAIALTAFARPRDRTRALLAGFQSHIAKPVDAEELVATVATLAGRTGREESDGRVGPMP